MGFETFNQEPPIDQNFDPESVTFEAVKEDDNSGELSLAKRFELAKESTEELLEKWFEAKGVLDAYKAVYEARGAVTDAHAQELLDKQHDKLRAIEQQLLERDDSLEALETAQSERKAIHERNINQGFTGKNLLSGYEADMSRYDSLLDKLKLRAARN